MAFFWIIAGVVYVLYKLHKEEKIFTKASLLLIGIFLAWGVLPWLVAKVIWGDTVANIVNVFLFGIPMLCICVYMIFVNVKDYHKPKKIRLGNDVTTITNNLDAEFKKKGYNVFKEDIEFLVKHPASPLNYNDQTVDKCYLWLCEQKTWEIDKLTEAQISEFLRVPLSEIPTDESLPLGEAYLKRELIAKQHILKSRGLFYRRLGGEITFNKFLFDEKYSLDFEEFISKYISEHQ